MDVEGLLPSLFRYKIVMLSKSEERENEFECLLRVGLVTEAELATWMAEFEAKSGTVWILRNSKKCDEYSRYTLNKNYICQHSSRGKKQELEYTGKNKDCKAYLNVRVKINSAPTRRDPYVKEGLRAVIKIHFHHSHSLDSPEISRFLKPSPETKQTFEVYFQNGMNPSQAIPVHEHLLEREDPKLLTDRRRNPPKRWVKYQYGLWRQKQRQKQIKEDKDQKGSWEGDKTDGSNKAFSDDDPWYDVLSLLGVDRQSATLISKPPFVVYITANDIVNS